MASLALSLSLFFYTQRLARPQSVGWVCAGQSAQRSEEAKTASNVNEDEENECELCLIRNKTPDSGLNKDSSLWLLNRNHFVPLKRESWFNQNPEIAAFRATPLPNAADEGEKEQFLSSFSLWRLKLQQMVSRSCVHEGEQ